MMTTAVQSVAASGGRAKRKGRLAIQLRSQIPLYLMLLPAVTFILLFCYYPMYGAQIAFRDYTIAKGITGSPWVGLKHFINFINYYQFWLIIKNTIRLSVYSLTAAFAVRLIFSLSLNCMLGSRYRKLVQTVTYMPHFISTVVMVGIVIRFLNPSLGIISLAIQALGGTNRDLMGVASAVPHIYVWSGIWQNAGWSTILFIAVLASVDPQLHESAIVDGASRFKRIWYIDMPTLVPTMVICLIMDFGGIMNVGFEKILLMQNNLNLSTTQVISTYVYQKGIAASRPEFSYTAAIGLFNSVISFFLVVVVNRIAKSLNQASLW